MKRTQFFNIITRIANIAEDLDNNGHIIDASTLTNVAIRLSQFNVEFDNERVSPYQRSWKYDEEGSEFEQLDDLRNKDPRYQTPNYKTLPGGESGPGEENANEENPNGLSMFDMGGRDKPIVTGPAYVANEQISPATSPLSMFEDKNRPKYNSIDGYKSIIQNRL